MANYIIIPGCDDGNRGDQALVWETRRVAEAAGFEGTYKMVCHPKDMMHSREEGIDNLYPILNHPGRKDEKRDNTKYTIGLKCRWGIIAIGDLIISEALKVRVLRNILRPHLSEEVQHTIDAFENCDAFFVKGGGFIHSYGSLTDIYLIYYFLYHIRFAQALKKPVYVMPNSFGPFKTPTVKYQVKRALGNCVYVTTRESFSHKQLSNIGIEAYAYPDLAFGLNKSLDYIPELNEIISKAGTRKPVAITARPYRFPEDANPSGKMQKYIGAVVSLCSWLFKNGYYPVFVEQVIANRKNESDLTCIESIKEHLEDDTYYILSNPQYTCRHLKSIYSEMYAVIGTRFHSIIFSLSEGVPCVAITYGGNKGQGIMRDMQLSEYAIPINEIEDKTLIEKVKLMFENYSSYKEHLSSAQLTNVERLKKLADEIMARRQKRDQ